MSNIEAHIGEQASEKDPIRIRRRFTNPNSPEGFRYGFVFRLVYCLVSFFFSIFSVLVASGIASLFSRNTPDVSSNFLVFVAIVTFAVPVFFGEVLRRRILDLTEKSNDGSVTVELTSSGLAFDEEQLLQDWEQQREVIDNLELRAVDHGKRETRFFRLPGAESINLITSVYGSRGIYLLFGKRFFDICVVLLAAPIVVPVVTIFAIMVKLSDPGPAFFFQQRVGKDGRVFRMMKLRTMVTNAEEQLKKHLAENPEAAAEWNASYILSSDPRITRIGAILRKTSLDELPQLWNVLTGDMSLVGPRPILPEQRQVYPGTAYYRLKPGISGYWQVSERYSSSFVDRAKYDDLYEAEASFFTDLIVLSRTVGAVIRATGY